MTAPQPPAPAQDAAQAVSPSPPAPVPAPESAPVPTEAVDPNSPWPPSPERMLQIMMDARFSIIDEPADEETQGADRQDSSAGTPPPQPQQQAPPQVQG